MRVYATHAPEDRRDLRAPLLVLQSSCESGFTLGRQREPGFTSLSLDIKEFEIRQDESSLEQPRSAAIGLIVLGATITPSIILEPAALEATLLVHHPIMRLGDQAGHLQDGTLPVA